MIIPRKRELANSSLGSLTDYRSNGNGEWCKDTGNCGHKGGGYHCIGVGRAGSAGIFLNHGDPPFVIDG